jgi:hypothetical protein
LTRAVKLMRFDHLFEVFRRTSNVVLFMGHHYPQCTTLSQQQ